MSSHGDSSVSGAGSSARCRINSAQIICSQVVPHFDGVLITTSSGRNVNPSQRALSVRPSR